MKKPILVAAVAAAALAVAACDKPQTNSAYINLGASATPAMPATSSPSQPATIASTEPLGQPDAARADATPTQPAASTPEPQSQVTSAPATSDTASPNAPPVTK